MEHRYPNPAIVVADCRTGGSFFCTCLSNHPAIFCERGEVLHWQSEWLHTISDAKDRLNLVFRQAWYEASMCKILSRHALEGKLWEFLKSYSDMKIIFLEREDILAQALSWEMNVIIRGQGGSSHSFFGRDKTKYKLDPEKVIWRYDSIVNRLVRSREILEEATIPVLYLTYEQLTGGRETFKIESKVANEICTFLGVEYWSLFTRMNKMHTVPWEEQIINWPEVQNALCERS